MIFSKILIQRHLTTKHSQKDMERNTMQIVFTIASDVPMKLKSRALTLICLRLVYMHVCVEGGG